MINCIWFLLSTFTLARANSQFELPRNELILYYTAIMAVSALFFLILKKVWHKQVPSYFFLIHTAIVSWSGLMYFNIYFNTPLKDYAWYLDWIVSTPLIILALGLSAMLIETKKKWDAITMAMGLQAITIVTGVLAQLSASNSAKLTFFIAGNVAMVGVFYYVWFVFMAKARKHDYDLYLKYRILAIYLIVFWVAYPAVWILGTPGYNYISEQTTTLLFVVLPILCKSGFGLLDLYLLKKVNVKKTAYA